MKFLYVYNGKIEARGEIPCIDKDCTCIEVSDEIFNNYKKYKLLNGEIVPDENWEEKQKQQERQELDSLYLTSSDVERALYKAKNMDFDDLKQLISEKIPQIDMKALSIEFRAKNFYRGAVINNLRIFDVVGELLGYSLEDMDFLFKNKQLPE